MSPLETAIQRVVQRGWFIKGLGRSEFDCVKPWFCCVHPAHFGAYYPGTKVKNGLYSVYRNAMVMFTGDGATALEAVNEAIEKIDRSKEKHVYNALEQAFEDMLDAYREKT